ncbi:MAG TPA: hypothetical protein DCR40_01470 [Prolixibacteraceae bacterium]|nr:hypothetical protein [Prolixibacteraceae bacterium]
MKKITLLISTFIISLQLIAQINKGSYLIEVGTNPGGNPTFIGTTGFSFSSKENFTKNFSDGVTHSYLARNYFSYSIAPRIGYVAFKNFVFGTDFQYHKHIYKLKKYDHNTDRFRSALYGVFIRQYFGKRKLLPLIEAGLGFGLSKSNDDAISPGGGLYQDIERRNLFYLSGAAGVSYSVNSKFRINLLAKGQKTIERPINTENFHYANSKIIDLDATMVLSFSYFLNKRQREDIKKTGQN